MPTKTTPVTRTLKIVPLPAGVTFADAIPGASRGGMYEDALKQCAKFDKVIVVAKGDHYLLGQIRTKAKESKFQLQYALDGDEIFVRVVNNAAEKKRLLLLLRDRRTLAWLEGQKLQLPLKETLNALAAEKLAHFHKDAWVLTERGHDAVIDPAAMAATA